MNIQSPFLLALLLLIPILVFLLKKTTKRLCKRFRCWAEEPFMAIYLKRRSPFYSTLKLVILIIALALLILAIARPQWDFRKRDLDSQGLDIIFAIDVSRSMDAKDIPPNRLLRAVLQINSFIDQLSGDRLGVISFAGAASIECPLTDDYDAVKLVLSSLTTNSAAREGTDIGKALDLAKSAFNTASGAGILILISDGEDLEKNSVPKARDLAHSGIRIYTMGVGSEEGALIRNAITGEEHITQLDSATLERIAKVSGGDFFRVTPGAAEIQLLLSKVYQNEKSQSRSRIANMYEEQYHIFVILSLILLAIEAFIAPLKRDAK